MERKMSEGQRAYEARRAAKAGMSLEKWLQTKERDRASPPPKPTLPPKAKKKPSFFSRLLDRAQKPL